MPQVDRDKRLAYWRDYYYKHREEKRAYAQTRYQSNRESIIARQKDYYLKNKELIKEYKREYHKRHPEVIRNWDLNSKYGIDIEKFEEMFALQKGLCMMCGEEMILKPDGRPNKHQPATAVVDHNHKNSEIRGLIHNSCNLLLGCARDNTDILKKAIDYLNYSQTKEG